MKNKELLAQILNRSGHPLDLDEMFPSAQADEMVAQLGLYLGATVVGYWMQDIAEAGITRFEDVRDQLPEWAVGHIEKGEWPVEEVGRAQDALENATMQRDWACLGPGRFLEDKSTDPDDGSSVECWSDGEISISGPLSKWIHQCAQADGVSPAEWVIGHLPIPQRT